MEDSRRCTAHLTDGSGQRCKKAAISGGAVCGTHGGGAPQVKHSARQRLLDAADPAAARLVRALESADERAAIRAAQVILDRAGLGPKSAVELSGPEGGPIETLDTAWIEYCTIDEKRKVVAIIDAAMARANSNKQV